MNLPKKFRIPIVLKLVAVTVTLLLVATMSIAIRSAKIIENLSGSREKDANGVAAEAKASQMNYVFDRYRDKILIVSSFLLNNYPTVEERNAALKMSFHEEADLISLQIVEMVSGKQQEVQYIEKAEFLTEMGLTSDYLK